MTTLLGKVQIDEQVFQKNSVTIRPLCEQLNLRCGGYSGGLQEAVVDFGSEDSFELAAARLSRHHPVKLSASTVRKITLKHAAEIKQRQKRNACLGVLPAQGADTIIAQADGTMLPVVDFQQDSATDLRKTRKTCWQEVRLCAARDAHGVDAVYGCDTQSVQSLGYRWSHCAGQAGWGLNSRIHVISDGAAWIAGQVNNCFGSQSTHLLDFYHVMDYLARAQKANADWMNPKKRWLQVQKRRLKKGQSQKVIAELEPHCEKNVPDEKAPIRVAWRYLSNHRHQLDYPAAIENELPIGSGLIEGGHRHVLQKRLKLSGAWWKQANLESMAHLRVCRANNQWNNYWKKAA